MSVYFEGNAYLDNSFILNTSVSNSTISNSTIVTSSLDMDLQNITSVLDPVLPQDAATKQYVDNLNIVYTTVTLTNSNPTLVLNSDNGVYQILVKSLVSKGPFATFSCAKNDSTITGHIIRLSSCVGELSNVSLRLTWPANSGIYLHKTGNSFDGSYVIKII
jgi:hypothetical protein